MRRVLHVDLSPRYRGGQRQLRLLAVAQQQQGTDAPTVVTASELLREQLRSEGVPAIRVSANPVLALPRIRRLVAQSEILHAHEARAHGLLRAARGKGLVVHRRIDDPPSPRRTTRWKYAAGTVLCVSEAVRSAMRTFGVPEERLRVVYSAAPSSESLEHVAEAGPLRVLALGALVEHKGHLDLVQAVRHLDVPVVVDVVGGGPLRRSLEQDARPLPIRFLGDPRGVMPRFETYDLLVHPSRTEGLGTATLDAQVAGLPVLATTAGGLPEAVAPSGWLVAPQSPRALAAQLAAIAALPRQELRARGAAARQWASRRFSVARMRDEVAAVYADVDSLK
ncbi:MAG: glycosyltransferase family 4 protein [Deltaproteobacteria bacterium]|nr:glycosyltransferase family 4 protein [Deltaproteobacteria bacterium]